MTQRGDGPAVPVMKLGPTTSSADGPLSWMTSSSGEVGSQGCPRYLQLSDSPMI